MNKSIAAIFDLDGVLVNTGHLHVEAWKIVLTENRIQVHDTYFSQSVMRDTEVIPELLGEITDMETEKLIKEKHRIFRSLIQNTAKPVAGVLNFLTLLHNHHIPSGIASSAPRADIESIISAIGCRALIDIVVSGDQIMRSKPAPDIFLIAAYRMHIEPQYTIVFEDAVAGVEAARTAGAMVIGVSTSVPVGELSHADMVIHDFRDPRLVDIFIKNR